MSDKILNKLNNAPRELAFSNKHLQMNERELRSELDKRITDLLHIIEFDNLSPIQAQKICDKLQRFLRKRRYLKGNGHIYYPRTESGKKIIDGKVIEKKVKKK